MARLGDYIEQIRGVSYKPDDICSQGEENAVAILRANNIQDDGLNFDDLVYVKKSKVSNNQFIKAGDIVVCASSGSKNLVGKASIAKVDLAMSFGAFCKVVRATKVLPEYLGYYFQSPTYRSKISDLAGGANINNIRNEHIDELFIVVPDWKDQVTIAQKLDKICELISFQKLQLLKLDELVKSRFIELFGDPEQNQLGWDKKPLSAIITNANNGMARRGNNSQGNIVMRLVELQDGYIDYSAPNRIILTDAEKQKYLLRDKDFLFARVNGNPEYVGRCAVFHEIGEPVYHNDHIIRVHFDDTVITGFFASALFNSTYGRRQMRSQIKTSAGQYTISQDGIGAIVAILPPLELQQQFAAFVEQTDKSKLAVQQSIEKLETLKKALMQKYFG